MNSRKYFKSKEKISLIIQTTQKCNLRCKHCYEGNGGYLLPTMPHEVLEKIISIAQKDYREINYLWFGGEPLCAGIEFFQDVIELQKKYSNGHVIRNSIQTNGVLLDDSMLTFFKQNDFRISISYDCQYNDCLRQDTSKTVDAIIKCKNAGLNVGVLSVVHSINYKNQYDMFIELQRMGVSAKFNRIFAVGTAEKNLHLMIDDNSYCEEMRNLFLYWLHQKEAPMFPAFKVILDTIFYSDTRECIYSGCLFKWLAFDPTGNMYTCPRFVGTKYCFGNVADVEHLYDAFYSDQYVMITKEAIARKEKCKQECNIYEYCHGGCNAIFHEHGDVSVNKSEFCNFNKEFFPFVIKTLKEEILNNFENINASIQQMYVERKEIFDQVFLKY